MSDDDTRPSAGTVKEPLAAMVARGLREAIVAGRLEPGERIKQDVVAAEYAVSRSPVREAFRELASEGFVVLERDVGARVTRVTRHSLRQLYFAREALEPVLIAETALRISEEELAEARAINDRAEQHALAGETADYLRLDGELHLLLLRASGLELLYEITSSLWQRTAPHRLAYTRAPVLELAMAEHRMILDAIGRRASEDAADLYRIHTRHTRVALSQGDGDFDDPED
jgi:DNA-binding GntR family transcriptional regulator